MSSNRSNDKTHTNTGTGTGTHSRTTPPPPLSLRPFRSADDAPLLRTWVTTPAELMTWAGPTFAWPLDDARLAAYAAEPDRHLWTAVTAVGDRPGEERPVGHASLLGTRLGRVLIAPTARGRGHGAAMVARVLDLAFGELALPEVGLGVWAHNTAALRIYERLGFRTVQVLADVEEVDGVRWSAHQMRLPAPGARHGHGHRRGRG
ncbi:GNAT family N-acetyltransferase [Streptomyces subrutilus]|uniref:GNAT family N-acetyltransferase n=1 Tax=Streptomyces subrutilus TaxID=36818 RepID=UPI0033EE59F9